MHIYKYKHKFLYHLDGIAGIKWGTDRERPWTGAVMKTRKHTAQCSPTSTISLYAVVCITDVFLPDNFMKTRKHTASPRTHTDFCLQYYKYLT